MRYNIVAPNGYGAETDNLSLLPSLKIMVEQGCRVYDNGKRLNKTDIAAIMRARKEKRYD